LAEEIAASLQAYTMPDLVYAVRHHPSDRVPVDVYKRLFAGLPCINTTAYPTDRVAAAADVFIGQRSTTLLRSVARQQPTINVDKYVPPGFSMPLTESGASLSAQPHELPPAITELLEGTSTRYHQLIENMRPYSVDGKAASRVADVVCAAGGLACWTQPGILV
jgi:hypothetical protein